MHKRNIKMSFFSSVCQKNVSKWTLGT